MLTLFGGAVWWLPDWLARLLPHVDIEGESESPPTPAPPSPEPPPSRERPPPRNRFDAPVLFSGI
jgi:RND superfamily putative drug exporter